jgi:methyl-accepting chemotaxis protein
VFKSIVLKKLKRIEEALELLAEKVGEIMAVSLEVQQVVAQLDQATNDIAARIQALLDRSPSLSEEDKAELNRVVLALQELGKDPANPVPLSV